MAGNLQLIVDDAMKPLQEVSIPGQLAALVERHHKTIMGLASSLLSGGKSDREVRDAIRLVCGSFETELLNTIQALAENEVSNAQHTQAGGGSPSVCP